MAGDADELKPKQPPSGIWRPEALPYNSREITAKNVSGSTAGAGSGDFHVYRQLRRKELFRVAKLEQDEREKRENEEFETKLQTKKQREHLRTLKRAEKRKRRKQSQMQHMKKPRGDGHGHASDERTGAGDGSYSSDLADRASTANQSGSKAEDLSPSSQMNALHK